MAAPVPRLEPRQRGPDTEMAPMPQGQMPRDRAMEIEFVRMLELSGVAVRRAPLESHLSALGEFDAMPRPISRDPPRERLHRRLETKHLFDRARDRRQIAEKLCPGLGPACKQHDPVEDDAAQRETCPTFSEKRIVILGG